MAIKTSGSINTDKRQIKTNVTVKVDTGEVIDRVCPKCGKEHRCCSNDLCHNCSRAKISGFFMELINNL